jgi:hypothetical protein
VLMEIEKLWQQMIVTSGKPSSSSRDFKVGRHQIERHHGLKKSGSYERSKTKPVKANSNILNSTLLENLQTLVR